jgi:hypothetical protein
LPEKPQHLVISNPEELEAFEIGPDTLKQMRNVCDPITAPFEDLDFVVEALLKPARLAVEKIVGDLVEPVVERSQKGIKAFQPTPFDLTNPVGDGPRGRLLALLGIKNGAQLFANAISFSYQ